MGTKSKNRLALTADRVARMGVKTILWDDTVIGFGARRQTGEEIKFIVCYRFKGRQRWYTIGRLNSPWQPASARIEAKRILGEVAAGRDPQAVKVAEQNEVSVADVVRYYLEVTSKAKGLKPNTVHQYKNYLDNFIEPKFGKYAATDPSLHRLFDHYHKEELGDRPPLANRVLMLLHAAFNKAGPACGVTVLPTRGIIRHRETPRQVRLTLAQVKALGEAMRSLALDAGERNAVAVIAVLLISSRRKNEVRKLKYDDLHTEGGEVLMTLRDHKTSRVHGPAVYVLADDAVAIIEGVKRVPDNPHVFPSTTRHGEPVKIDDTWEKLSEAAGIVGVTIHDLRRTAGDHAAALDVELNKTAAMLGHADARTTKKHYIVANAIRMKPTVERVGASLAAILNGPKKAA